MRPLRYTTLTAVALKVLAGGVGVVAAAPWTRELGDGVWFAQLSERARERGGRLAVAICAATSPSAWRASPGARPPRRRTAAVAPRS